MFQTTNQYPIIPMVFLWFSYGFPMVPILRVYIHQVIYELPQKMTSPSDSKAEVTGWNMISI